MTGDHGPQTDEQTTADPVLVDSVGKPCPMPVIDLAKAVDAHPIGTEFHLRATDEAARVDIPVWCRMQRQQLVDVVTEQTALLFVVRKIAESRSNARN